MKPYVLVIVVFAGFVSVGQSLVNYTSVRNTGITYNSISGTGNSFSSWRNTTSFTQDDNRSVFTNIGFDFWYLGVRFTQFSASTNGFIDFSTSTDDGGPAADDFGYSNAAFTTANINNSTRPAIAPFYDDLTTQGGVDPIGTSIKYLVTGSAPNRTLTVEWINMAVFGNVSPSLNFQVQLLESSGVIKINYGTMNSGTFTFSYSMGLNGPTISASPTAAQLKMLQTVNGNTFNNTVQNNLSAMPAANSQYVFTPVAPTPVSGSLSFSGVSQTGMTLNWSNWASNERGYVIYNSTDGTNFNFVTQTAVNAVNSAITGLSPSTTYFWRVFAVTEGALSSALTGTQATLGAGNKISLTSGNWNTANTWTPNGVPTAGDNVTINNGHLVNINTNAVCNALTVGAGTGSTLQFTGGARSMTINSNLVVNTNAIFDVNTGSNATHLLTLEGNLSNNGSISFSVDANSLCNLTFSSFTTQVVNGTGNNRFNLITQNTGSSRNHFLDVSCSTFSAATNFLTLNNGTFKLSTTSPVNITPFTAATTISNVCGLWINSIAAAVSTGAGITLSGGITVSNGTLTIGNAADEDLFSDGGEVIISSGALNVSGKYYSTGINNISNFSISGGTLTLPTLGSSSTSDAPFQVTGVGSEFDMTGGLIVIQREGGTGAQDLGFINTGASSGIVTGGTLQIGNASTPATQSISINSNSAIGNLLINSSNATALISTNTLQVINDVVINSGRLNDNNLTIGVAGNWTNNGGVYVDANGTVLFNSSSGSQSILKSGGETFNNLAFSGAGLKNFSSAVSAKGFTLNTGASVDISASNHQLSLTGNFTNNGNFLARSGLVLLNGNTAQTLGGTSVSNFFDLTLNNTAGASLSSSENIIGNLTLNNGNFSTNGQTLTLVSTATATARVAQITGTGDITGDVTVQRFVPGGTTGWAFLGTPIVSGLTLQDWDDDIFISCSTCPDGSAGGFLSVYSYNEAAPGTFDDASAYVGLGGITDAISFGRGLWVYFGNGQFTTTDITLDVTGSLNKNNLSIPLSYSNFGSATNDGWNLIHNPYPSAISWNAMRGSTPNLDNAIYVYNADLNGGLGAYASFVNGISSPAVGSGGIGDNIPMGQAFYVHSTGATAISTSEAIKVANNPTFLKSSAATQNTTPLVRLNLIGASGALDETVLYLNALTTSNFDAAYDAYKLPGTDLTAPTLALEVNNELFQINGIAPVNGNYTVALKALSGVSGNYTITASEMVNFPSGTCIHLYDTFLNTSIDLTTNSCAVYLHDTTQVSRFVLSITLNSLTVNSSVQQPVCSNAFGGEIVAQGTNSGPWNYYWKDTSGFTLKSSLNKFTADTLDNLSAGNFYLEINSVGQCDRFEDEFSIVPISIPVAAFTCVDSLTQQTGGFIQFTNTSTNGLHYHWDFGDGVGNSSGSSAYYTYNSAGIYTVVLIAESVDACNDTAIKTISVIGGPISLNEISNFSGIILKSFGNNLFQLEGEKGMNQKLGVSLLDAQGKTLTQVEPSENSKINIELNLEMYPKGIYFLKLQTTIEYKVLKLVVQ